MKHQVIAFAGRIGSGKSTISMQASLRFGWKYMSFGDYVRYLAQEQGLPPTRDVLQDIGEQCIAEGWSVFCKKALDWAGYLPAEPLVIDGIRHKEALNELAILLDPAKIFLVYINIDENTRSHRLIERDKSDKNLSSLLETHSTEVQVISNLIQKADLILDSTENIEINIQKIKDFLQNQ